MILFGVLPVDWVTGTIALITVSYIYLTWNFDYWKKRGVPHEKPRVLFGNYGDILLARKNVAGLAGELYQKYDGRPLVGLFRIRTPTLLVRDPELVKAVLVKDFQNFSKNAFIVNPELDPLFTRNPFFSWGQKWKRTRSMLTPSFTSGKLKMLYPLMKKVTEDLDNYLQKQAPKSSSDGLEAKELCSKFTTDVVAICAFGVEAKSFQEEKGGFLAMNKKMLSPDFFTNMRLLFNLFFPELTGIFRIRFMPLDVAEFYRSMIKTVVSHRESNNEARNDFLQLLMQLKQKAKTGELEDEFTDEDVTAHAVTFITDGFETSSIAMSFLLYQLAMNPDVQDKLREELQKAEEENGGKLELETIFNLPYLSMVLAETLRMNTPLMVLEKTCSEKCELTSKDGSKVQVEPGTLMLLPAYAMHHDPKYFPDPEKFDPERFSEARKNSIPNYAYIPFGEGPRICIGMKFAQMQIKAGVARLVMNYDIKPTAKTPKKIIYDVNYFLAAAKGGLWLNFIKRH